MTCRQKVGTHRGGAWPTIIQPMCWAILSESKNGVYWCCFGNTLDPSPWEGKGPKIAPNVPILCLPHLATCDKPSSLVFIYSNLEVVKAWNKTKATKDQNSSVMTWNQGHWLVPSWNHWSVHSQTTDWSHSKLWQPYSKTTILKLLIGPIPNYSNPIPKPPLSNHWLVPFSNHWLLPFLDY